VRSPKDLVRPSTLRTCSEALIADILAYNM
jgi:hypothetical protein